MDVKIQNILAKRHYLYEGNGLADTKMSAYYSAFLLSNFGIIVDKPLSVTKEMVNIIRDLYKLNVPHSYFNNPQDMKYYTKDEIFIEQILSYMLAYGEDDCHIEVFKKDLPEYVEGDELKLRSFEIITESKAVDICKDILKSYFDYKRPWSIDEFEEVKAIYSYIDCHEKNCDVFKENILCGDNAIMMLDIDFRFARNLYKKDLVKLSINKCGDHKTLDMPSDVKAMIRACLPYVKDCPMSKKQAKYFNKLISATNAKGVVKTSNVDSPYRLANIELEKGNVVGAAKVFANSGSLLERNLKMLLSRASWEEAPKIVELIGSDNPIVLWQLASTITADKNEPRTFTFTRNGLVKKHVETDYEIKWRKSRLKENECKLIHDICLSKIGEAYRKYESLGKVYISKAFNKIGVPINTSASGRGVDVIPTGSRLPINSRYIRTFVHWENAFDIDSSILIENKYGQTDWMDFRNYRNKSYGHSVLFSGDVTSANGTEYYDIDIDAMKERGCKSIIFSFHGYCSRLDKGEIYCGYQNKDDLETKAWDPKNIALKIHVKGDTRACMGFAIDLENKEIVVLNTLIDDESRVVNSDMKDTIKKYMSDSFLELNMGNIISYRGEVVDNPEDADIVFDDDYLATNDKKVVRTYDIEKMVSIVNGKLI